MFVIDEAKFPAADARRHRDQEQGRVRHPGFEDDADQHGRDEEHQRADDGPVAAAEHRHGEGVGHPQEGSD
jgi:hypothetical protein